MKEQINLLKESIEDDIEQLQIKRTGIQKLVKRPRTPPWYKTYIALSEERIITAAIITTGEKSIDARRETENGHVLSCSTFFHNLVRSCIL